MQELLQVWSVAGIWSKLCVIGLFTTPMISLLAIGKIEKIK